MMIGRIGKIGYDISGGKWFFGRDGGFIVRLAGYQGFP
jgi:hypothetical protein